MSPRHHPAGTPQGFLTALGMTLALMLLVAGGIADRGGVFPLVVLGGSWLAVGALYLLIPHGPQFALSAANGLAMYACLFAVMGRAGFPDARDWARPLAFLLPVLAFLLACWIRRNRLRAWTQGRGTSDLSHLPRFARWLLAIGAVGAVSLSLPVNRLDGAGQSFALLAAMAIIAGISAISVGDVVRLLVDIAALFRELTGRLSRLVVPVAAYSSLWALLTVVFGCLYRIADGVSRAPLFIGMSGPIRMSFSDALHFSVVTLSTVGYGDIHPADDGIRLLAGIEMLLGQLLLLFGFYEIMRGSRAGVPEWGQGRQSRTGHSTPGTDLGHAAQPGRPGGAGEYACFRPICPHRNKPWGQRPPEKDDGAMTEAERAAFWRGRRVLVTGGAGFLGSGLCHALAGLGARVTALDAMFEDGGASMANLEGASVLLVRGDIRDAELHSLCQGVDVLFNMAAQTSHMGGQKDPVADIDINAVAQVRLIGVMREAAPQASVVHASTRQFYGRPLRLPVDEMHPVQPPDANGVSKWAGEQYWLLEQRVHHRPVVSLRLTNCYGPRLRIRDARQTFLGIWIRRVLEGEGFEVWGGEQLRDLAYVDDVVNAFLLAAETAARPDVAGRIFNLGGAPPASLKDLAERLIAANDGRGHYLVKQFPADRAPIDIGSYHADDRAFREATGWAPQVGLDEGLRRTLDWYRVRLADYL